MSLREVHFTHRAPFAICRVQPRENLRRRLRISKHWAAVTCHCCLKQYPGDIAKLQRVRLKICSKCLEGNGAECRTPGCLFEGERPPEWPLSVGAIEWIDRELSIREDRL